MTESEKNRLNELGAKVMGWEQKQGWADWWFPKSKSVTLEDAVLDWNPYEKPSHWEMVLEEILKQHPEWSFSLDGDSKCCSVLFYESAEGLICHGNAEAPLNQKGRAILLACEKALEE